MTSKPPPSPSDGPDPVARVLTFRRWRWGWWVFYAFFAIPLSLAFLSPGLFLLLVPLGTIVGIVFFIRLGRYRLSPDHFEGNEAFERLIDALPQTFGTHLYLRERYARGHGAPDSIDVVKRKSCSGIRSDKPFLVMKAGKRRLFMTPRRYWLQNRGTITSGNMDRIAIETFDIEEKAARPRKDDEVLGSTWRYATKNGDRDLRFNDNQELWLVRRHAVELAIGNYRGGICLYGLGNARTFVSTLAEITHQPIEHEYQPDVEDEDEVFFEETPPPVPRRWFEVLGVPPQASIGEIKTAYRTLLQQYHPDQVAHFGEKLRRAADEAAAELIRAYKEGISARGQD